MCECLSYADLVALHFLRCCSIDQEPLRFLIGDVYGRLSMLSLENVNETGLVLVPLGEVRALHRCLPFLTLL